MLVLPQLSDLVEAVINGEVEQAIKVSDSLLRDGLPIESLIDNGLTVALRALDTKCTNEEFNLLEIMLAGRAMMTVMDEVVSPYLYRHRALEPADSPDRTIVIGTIKGDIHDLGKHIVEMLLTARGFRIIDIGRDVEPVDFVRMAILEGARYIGVSSLLTISIPYIREIKEILKKEGLDWIKVIAGGAAIQQTDPEDINVDYIARDVFEAIRYLDSGFRYDGP